MMKKRLLTLCVCLTAMTLCSCSLSKLFPLADTPKRSTETVAPYLEVVPDELTYSEGYTPLVSTLSYDTLPLEGEKKLYDKMLGVCYDISAEKEEDAERYAMPQIELQGYSLTEAQVRTACKALTDDHPEIFWTTGTIGYYSDDSSTVIQVYSSYSPQEVDSRVNAVRAAASAFYATVPDDLSEYEREKMVHDYLIDHVAYDDDVDTINFDNNNPDIYTAYGALVNQVAVCEGYARAFQMLMNGLGVECGGVIGESEGQMHIWNVVRLDGSWYHTDVTWDDQEKTYAHYIYFNVDDDYISDDHTFAPLFSTLSDDEINGVSGEYSASIMNIFVPDCSKEDMTYYVRESPRLSDYDGENVKSGLLRCAEAQDDYFIFYIDEDLDYQSAVTLLFADSPQYFFSYINAVNNTLDNYSIDSSNVAYMMHEKSRMVAVEMHYY